MDSIEKQRCQFSPCGLYRYTLTRLVPVTFALDERRFEGQTVMFIGLNPSTADDIKDDPTIRRCKDFASRWGFTLLVMTNLFAFRATDPAVMKKHREPIGPDNDEWLRRRSEDVGLIIAAWGRHGSHLNRAAAVKKMLPQLHCLRRNADGSPEHPLYIPAETLPVPF